MNIKIYKFIIVFFIYGFFGYQCYVPKVYSDAEEVILYVNKVGPYFNPHETYIYYTLPVCRTDKVEFIPLSLGEVLDGDRMVKSMYKFYFKKNSDNSVLCHLSLNNEQINKFIHAIEDLYYFEFILDENIPIRGFIGKLEEKNILPHSHKALLYTHHNFEIQYNKNNIIYAIILTTQPDPIDLIPLKSKKQINITFSYSVKWILTDTPVEKRDLYVLNNNFFSKVLEIHWISITNSLILIFLLIMFIMLIIGRVLHRDFARYNRQNGSEITDEDGQEERGWKIIHNDVFRPPQNYRLLFCGIIGTGIQMLSIAVGLVVLALFNVFEVHNHGIINAAALFLFSITSWIAGFVGTRLYKLLENTQNNLIIRSYGWVRLINVICVLFTIPLTFVWILCDIVSVMYGTTHSMPIPTILQLVATWIFIGYPLTIAGGMLGRRSNARIDTGGCRARNIPREIPSVPWYKSRWIYLSLGGFLPFSSVCIELYYIFSTIWGREHYNLYGILFIVMTILIIVTICVSISLIYFQLVMEDYRWWWASLHLGLSSATFAFIYCVFHYFYRSKMRGFLQTIEYFSYSILGCYAFFLGISAVSFFSSLYFVRFMYRNIKLD